MEKEVVVTLSDERLAMCNGETVRLPAGIALSGQLTMELSDGPLGIREYEHPSYIEATFDFQLDGRNLRYTGLISQWALWAPTGTQVLTHRDDFINEIGPLDGMMDTRDDWSYVLPDGTKHTNRLKYTSCRFWIMTQTSSFVVRCEYYDRLAGMTTIFYTRPLEKLLLLKDIRLSYGADGNIEDFQLQSGNTITLKQR